MPQKEEIQKEDENQNGDKAADPLDIHEFMTGELLHVSDGNKIGGASDRRTETADTAPPADGKEYRQCQFTVGNIFFTDEFQHADGDGAEYGGDDGIWQKCGKHDGRAEPYEDLLTHRRADKTKGAQ